MIQRRQILIFLGNVTEKGCCCLFVFNKSPSLTNSSFSWSCMKLEDLTSHLQCGCYVYYNASIFLEYSYTLNLMALNLLILLCKIKLKCSEFIPANNIKLQYKQTIQQPIYSDKNDEPSIQNCSWNKLIFHIVSTLLSTISII